MELLALDILGNNQFRIDFVINMKTALSVLI